METVHVPDEAVETQHVPDLPKFGRFQALAEIGAGAMGTVYRAHDDVLGRPVAIKVLHARDASVRERFLREAKAIGAVPHPNILAVYDAVADQGTPYLVMELAAGSLRDRLQAGAMPVEAVRELGIQIARGLAAAHAAHILHRDIKPGNILVGPAGVWKLADFGIARTPDSTLTASGQFLGSPSYASPEALRAGEFSPASDVYGLGATLYEALTGAPPHGHDLPSIMRKLHDAAVPVAARRAVPGALSNAIMAALALDPRQRPSAEAFANLLATSHPVSNPPHVGIAHVAPRPPVPARAGSNRTLLIVIVAIAASAFAVLAIAVLGIFWLAGEEIARQEGALPPIESEQVKDDEPDEPEPPTAPLAPSAPQAQQPTSPPANWAGDPATQLTDCMNFSSSSAGKAHTVTWSGCPDNVVRQINCRPFMRKLSCDCLEDGVRRWFFNTEQAPDFSTRETSSRIGRTQCKMGFGN